jgi:hypothetical protein
MERQQDIMAAGLISFRFAVHAAFKHLLAQHRRRICSFALPIIAENHCLLSLSLLLVARASKSFRATTACDLVMPDFMRIGGVTGWLRASAIAGAAGIPMSTHLYPEVAAHVMRVTETAHWLEWQDWADPVLQKPYEIHDGLLHIPNVPGVGLEWNEEAVAASQANL